MVLAHHLIWVAYGWWLPNDPRGSMSHYIASDIIAALGELHYGRKRVQPASRDIRSFYDKAAGALKFPLLRFSPRQIAVIGDALAEVIAAAGYTCYACAILSDHVHLVIRKHRDLAEIMIEKLQDGSRQRLIEGGHRHIDHPVWGAPGWKVFLDSPEDIRRTVKYVEENPIRARMPPQSWDFVKPYDGWPLHKRKR